MPTNDRTSGIALIAGFAALIITMAFHPTGRDLVQPGAFDHVARINIAVHALALLAMPFIYFGTIGLSRRVGGAGRGGLLALVLFGFGSVAGMIAGTASGLIAPRLAAQMLNTQAPESAIWRVAFHSIGDLNQGFAIVYVIASGAAILVWSIIIVRGRSMPAALGVYGCIIGPLLMLAVASGHLRLHVHGFGLVVLAQAIFFVAAGTLLMQSKGAAASATAGGD